MTEKNRIENIDQMNIHCYVQPFCVYTLYRISRTTTGITERWNQLTIFATYFKVFINVGFL